MKLQKRSLSKAVSMSILIFLAPLAGHAQKAIKHLTPKIEFGEAMFGGNGCINQQGVDYTYDEISKKLTIRYDQLAVQAQEDQTLTRAHCAMALPISVPKKYKLVVSESQLILNADIYTAEAHFASEIFFAGSTGIKLAHAELGFKELLSFSVESQEVLSSDCGESVNLRTNASVLLKKISNQLLAETAQIANVNYNVELVRCK